MEVVPTIRLKEARLQGEARRHGLHTQAAIARHLNISEATLWRACKGAVAPSAELIAKTLTAFTEARFSDFFEVVTMERAA